MKAWCQLHRDVFQHSNNTSNISSTIYIHLLGKNKHHVFVIAQTNFIEIMQKSPTSSKQHSQVTRHPIIVNYQVESACRLHNWSLPDISSTSTVEAFKFDLIISAILFSPSVTATTCVLLYRIGILPKKFET